MRPSLCLVNLKPALVTKGDWALVEDKIVVR